MNGKYFHVTAVSIAAALMLAVLGVFATDASGVPRSWTGAIDNDWFTGGNWSPVGGPASNDVLSVLSGTPRTGLRVIADGGGSIAVATPLGKADFNDLTIGSVAGGSMDITLGGDVTSAVGYVGMTNTGDGNVNVSGAGSTWNNSARLYIGHYGNAELVVQESGEVTSGDSFISYIAGSSSMATVTGGGSQWTTDKLTVGDDGSGALTVTDGGLVSSSFGAIANGPVASGTASVTGAGSEWAITGALSIGSNGTGKLTVGGGGKVRTDSTLSVGGGGTVDLNGGGLIVTNSVSLASGAVFNANVGSALRTNTLSGFGNTAAFGGDLHFGNFRGSTAGAHTVSAGQTFDVSHELIVGYNAPADFTQTGGAVTAGIERIGYSSNGTYTLSGGSLTVNYYGHIGFMNTGVFTQSNGTHQVNGSLAIGKNGGTGTYNLSGGVLTAESVWCGDAGPGIFNQTGGTHNAGEVLRLGRFASLGSGTYDLSGAASQLTVDEEYVGHDNTGLFTQSNGTHQVNGVLFLGYGSGTGTYNLSGGTLTAHTVYVGWKATSFFNQTGGTHNVTGGSTLCLGFAAGSMGTYTLDDGNLNTDEVRIAENGSGTFIQNGGSHSVDGTMYVGHVNKSTEVGRYELHGGTLTVGSNEYVGDYGAGEFLQTDGAHTVQGDLYVGTYDGTTSIGSYDMTGGTLEVTGVETVGAGTDGVFTQSAGTHTVQGDLTIGGGALHLGLGDGTYNLSATGVLNSNADVCIGSGDPEMEVVGIGLFDQSGGAHTVAGTLHVGHYRKWSGGVNGTYDLSDGTLDVGDHIYVGHEGDGEFNQSGSGQSTTGQLVVGFHADATGTCSLDGGTMTASISETVGYYGTGVFNQSGGVNDAGVSLVMGSGGGSVGTYNLDGGAVSADHTYLGTYGMGHFKQTAGTHTLVTILVIASTNYEGSGGTYDLQGGDLSVADETIGEEGTGTFTQSGGTHTVSGELTISRDQGSNGSYALSGGDLSAGTEYIGYQDAASFNQTGGTHTVTGDLYMSRFWNPSTTNYALGPAGTLSVGRDEYVGYWGPVEFTQTGGTHEVGGDLIVGYEVDGFCSYDLSGGASVLTVDGNERIGDMTFGNFTQSDGTHTVAGQLIVANESGVEASFTLGGGTLSAGSETIGNEGVGQFTQTDGAHTVTGALTMGYSGWESSGTFNLGGGTLQANEEIVGKGTQGTFNQTGGTNTVTTTLTIADRSGGEEEGSGQGTYNLEDGALTAPTVDNNDTVNQSGGTLETTTFNNAGTFNQTGGTMTADTFNNTSSPTTYVYDPAVFKADTVNNTSEFYQYGGTVRGDTALMGTFNNTGSFHMSGGTFEDRLVNQGYVYYSGGTFNGILEHWNDATFDRDADFTAEGGIINYGTMESAPGRQLNANGFGIQNYGEFYLNGGTCAANTFTNDFGAHFEAYGTLDSNLVNNGTLETAGMFIVTGTTTNMGEVRIESTEHLLATGAMTSSGIVEMAGGSLGGPGALVNQPGGIIRGFGGVSAPTTNDGGIIYATGTQLTFADLSGGNANGGELRVADGSRLQIVTPLVSSGTIVMEGENAALLGGTISNTGTLSGAGRVSNVVLNDGVIRATGGTLTLSGAGNTNTGLGRIEAQDAASVVVSQGLAVNAGTIALTGGTFDNNARAMTNTGSILGRGTVSAGGLANDGLMAFADGDTDIFGDVTNNNTVNVTECTTTFFSDVTNAVGATIKNTDGTVRFLGDFVNNGTYTSDPADNCFIDITVGTTGSFIGGEGDRFLVAGDFDNASEASTVWGTTEAELVFPAAAHTLELPGADMGTTYAGMDDNFAWGILRLAENGSLTLADGNSTGGGAIYVTTLILEDGLSQVASITGNGFSIYYDPASPNNAYLDARTFDLTGGGQIAPFSSGPTTLTWDGTDPGDWTGAHWNPGPVAPVGDEHMVVNSGTAVVSSDLTTTPAASLAIADGLAAGTVRIGSAGALVVTGGMTVGAGGTLSIDGTLTAPVVNAVGGSLTSSTGSVGVMTIDGNVSLSGGATLDVECIGPGLDRLAGTGTVTLGADAALGIALAGPEPALGHTMALINAPGGRTGMFHHVTGVLFGANKAFAVTYQPNGATVTVARPGDVDLDKTVGFNDFTFLAANYGQSGKSWVDGDVDGSGDVAFADFTYLAANYGTSDPDGAAEAPSAGAVELRVDVVTGEMWLVGNAATLSGYNITSAAGSLVPDGDGAAAPFQFYLSNLADDISAASLGAGVPIDGESALDAGYDTAAPMDLEFSYGVFGQGGSVSGQVVAVPEPTCLAMLALGALAMFRRKHR